MHDSIALTDSREELVAKAFAARRTLHKSSNVDELQCSRYCLFALIDLREDLQPRVRNFHDTSVGFDRTEGIVGGFSSLRFSEGIEESTLANVGQTDDGSLQLHGEGRARVCPTARGAAHHGAPGGRNKGSGESRCCRKHDESRCDGQELHLDSYS